MLIGKDFRMPSIFIIFMVILFFALVSTKKSVKNKSAGRGSVPHGSHNGTSYGSNGADVQKRQQNTYNPGTEAHYSQVKYGQQANATNQQQNVKVVPNKESNPMYKMSTGEGGDHCSTGFLLNESDHFDESAHPKLGNGQGVIARCHNDWDRVPQGYRVVKCCYCGAGNEVPVRKKDEYKCYFCWKKL